MKYFLLLAFVVCVIACEEEIREPEVSGVYIGNMVIFKVEDDSCKNLINDPKLEGHYSFSEIKTYIKHGDEMKEFFNPELDSVKMIGYSGSNNDFLKVYLSLPSSGNNSSKTYIKFGNNPLDIITGYFNNSGQKSDLDSAFFNDINIYRKGINEIDSTYISVKIKRNEKIEIK